MIARSTRAEFWLLLQKYRLAVSRGPVATAPGEGSDDRWSSSSESQPDEHDEDAAAAAELRGAFAAGGGTKEAPCDSPRSMARMQREVQRKPQEQIEVNDRSIAIPSSWHGDQAELLMGSMNAWLGRSSGTCS